MTTKKESAGAATPPDKPVGGSSCHNAQVCREPLYLVRSEGDPPDTPHKRTFGHVPLCTKCQKPCGDYRLGVGAPKAFNSTSWVTMMKVHPWPPYGFERQSGFQCLVPEGYKPEPSELEEDPRS
jgi:hypothetical protein